MSASKREGSQAYYEAKAHVERQFKKGRAVKRYEESIHLRYFIPAMAKKIIEFLPDYYRVEWGRVLHGGLKDWGIKIHCEDYRCMEASSLRDRFDDEVCELEVLVPYIGGGKVSFNTGFISDVYRQDGDDPTKHIAYRPGSHGVVEYDFSIHSIVTDVDYSDVVWDYFNKETEDSFIWAWGYEVGSGGGDTRSMSKEGSGPLIGD